MMNNLKSFILIALSNIKGIYEIRLIVSNISVFKYKCKLFRYIILLYVDIYEYRRHIDQERRDVTGSTTTQRIFYSLIIYYRKRKAFIYDSSKHLTVIRQQTRVVNARLEIIHNIGYPTVR